MVFNLKQIVEQFSIEGHYLSGEPFGSGHINDTFIIHTSDRRYRKLLLQRVNHHVFKNVPQLMKNFELVTRHIKKKIEEEKDLRFEKCCYVYIPTKNSSSYYKDSDGNFWRLVPFIENSHSYNVVNNPDLAYKGGWIFGKFLAWVADLSPNQFFETILHFHDVEKRLLWFDEAVERDPLGRVKEVQSEIEFVRQRQDEMKIIQKLGREGRIPLRVTHNDTKFNNILFDTNDNPLCVVDLDTVMPGYVHFDFGDAIRICANRAAEDEPDLDKIQFDLELFKAFAKGYLKETRQYLNQTEIDYLAFSSKLMTFIMGLRFLTDYVDGDHYYKIHHPKHNLQRARAQFTLLKRMEENYEKMREIIFQLNNNTTD